MEDKFEIVKPEQFDLATVKGTNITIKDVQTSLAKCEKSFEIFNHSHTQYMWKTYNLSHYGDLRNIRQVTAELIKAKSALSDAKYRFLKKQAKLAIKVEKSQNTKLLSSEKLLLDIEIEEMQQQSIMLRTTYEGCMKDVMTLVDLYQQLQQKIIDKYGKFDEEVVEQEEGKYWIRRLFAQSLRDVRECGSIKSGNQEALEQIGINVSSLMKLFDKYLKEEASSNNMCCNSLHKQLDRWADLYKDSYKYVLQYKGLDSELNTDTLYKLEE